jgi:hypothetical protein
VIMASVGINTSTTTLSVKDRVRQVTNQPNSTSGSHQPNVQPIISARSCRCIAPPHVTAAPHRLNPLVLSEFRAQPFDMHGDR